MLKKVYILVVLSICLFASGCSSTASGDYKKIESKIEKALGVKAVILDEPYEVLSVVLYHPPFEEGLKSVEIDYGIREGREPNLNSKGDIRSWEESHNAELWYDVYTGISRIEMKILTTSISGDKIDNVYDVHGYQVEVAYKELDNGQIIMFAYTNIENGAYMCTFILDDHFSEEEALEWLTALLMKVKEKNDLA